jgi:uncharacterized heparinase superfamily protein
MPVNLSFGNGLAWWLALRAHTARHLRAEQLLYLPLRRLQSYRPAHTGAVPNAVPRYPEPTASTVAAWGASHEHFLRVATQVSNGRFEFLGHTELLPQIDWQRRYVSHLWSYNLHYFDYGLDLAWAHRTTGDIEYVRRFEELATGWIRGTAAGRGDGWAPYAVSLRVVNWAYALWLLGERVHRTVRASLEASMGAQLTHLERRLERHILANHLQKNLKALVVGGLYFGGEAGERWLRRGTPWLWRELFEQVLPDGVHYERSPMYHAIALGDFLEVLDLLRAAGRPVLEASKTRVEMMVEVFGALSRPDGSLHLFNDAADGIAPERSWLDAMARRVVGRGIPEPVGAIALPEAGYFGYTNPAAGERLLIDCGETGPRYQPGHGHCDLLSFELDLGGRPVVVDAGVFGYEAGPLREYIRSTRAHNTVMIGGREQAEVWGAFRMARRPIINGAQQAASGDRYRFSGEYSPYHDRAWKHRRTVERVEDGWTVSDQVEGTSRAVTSFLHLHPDFRLTAENGGFTARAGLVTVRLEPFGISDLMIRRGEMGLRPQGWHCPRFGVADPGFVLEMRVRRNDGTPFGYRIALA